MKTIGYFFVFALLTAPTVFAARDCKNQRYLTIAEQLANLSPRGDVDFLSLDFLDKSNVSFGYEYEVEPAYTKGLYARYDKWKIGTSILGDADIGLSGDNEIDNSIGPKFDVEATFIRFFKDPCRAMLSVPYSPLRSPLSTKVALSNKFNVGDYFFFKGSAGFVVNAQILNLISSSSFGVSVGGGFLLGGFYQVNIVKIDEKHVRLKVITHRGRNVSANVGVGVEEFNVFKVDILDDGLNKIVNTKPLSIQANINNSKVFMIDYVLDLKDREVAKAYDKMISKLKNFKQVELSSFFKEANLTSGSLVLDLTPLEELYRRDLENSSIKRIIRNLKSTSEQKAYGFSVVAGNKIIGGTLGGSHSTARMNVIENDDIKKNYVLISSEKNSSSRLFFSFFKNSYEEAFRVLSRADRNFKDVEPLNIVKSLNQKKSRFTANHYNQVKEKLKKALPADIYSKIPWWEMRQGDKALNFGLRFEVIMSPDAILSLPRLTNQEIEASYREYILNNGFSATDFFMNSSNMGGNPRSSIATTAKEKYNSSLRDISKRLTKIMDYDRSLENRLDELSKLRRNLLFQESGFGYIMNLAPKTMSENYYINLDVSTNDNQIDFEFGDVKKGELYNKIISVKAALDDAGFDLQREAESLALPKLIPQR